VLSVGHARSAEQRFKCGGIGRRGLFGKSSGGYGALSACASTASLCGCARVTSFALIRNAADRRGGALVFFVFDLLHLVSKRLDAAYSPGQRELWLKTKCLDREEFGVVGWTDAEGSRPFIGALLLACYDPDGRLIYAGRVGSGMRADQLADLLRRFQPLRTNRMPLDVAPPRSTRFGLLSRVHWVRPELVVEVKYLTWTDDCLLRQVVYEGVREDKPARKVVRP
jgi:ATP dependent DNA ligase C terminal region